MNQTNIDAIQVLLFIHPYSLSFFTETRSKHKDVLFFNLLGYWWTRNI